MSKRKNKIFQYRKSMERQSAIEQGAYDGRFRSRVVPDKKKVSSKLECRKWKK